MDFIINLFSIDNVMATVFGLKISYFEAITAMLTLPCVILAARGKVISFVLGMICTTLFAIYFYQVSLYSSMLLQMVFFCFYVYGYYQWTHPKKDEENKKNQLKVSYCTRDKYLLFAAIIAVGTLLWGYVMSNPPAFLAAEFADAKFPYIDAFVLVSGIVAQFMLANKKIENWYIWIFADIIATALYVASNATFMAIMYGLLVFNAMYGLYMWRKMYKRGE